MNNIGKQFESQLRKGIDQVTSNFIRYADPTAGFAGITNFCDFGLYSCPYMFYIECKARTTSRLDITLNKNASGLTKNQYDGMLHRAQEKGVMAGVMVWFIEAERTVFVPIDEIKKLREIYLEKSLRLCHIDPENPRIKYVDIPCRKRRILYDYDGVQVINTLRHFASNCFGEEFIPI